MTKLKQARLLLVFREKAIKILQRCLKVDHPELKLYTLKVGLAPANAPMLAASVSFVRRGAGRGDRVFPSALA